MRVTILLAGYYIFINLIGFFVMGIDKRKAVKHTFRIPESTLFIIAAIGGRLGSILGMYTFRHKTRHRSFLYAMPFILFVQIALIIAVLNAPIDISVL